MCMKLKTLRDMPKDARMLLVTRKDNTSPVLAASRTMAASTPNGAARPNEA